MIINHNMRAMNAQRNLSINTNNAAKSMEKLSSGLRINRAGDDAAGLSISEKMRAQIRGLDKASDNAQDGISMIQTAEGALNETHSILQRMRELATQAANDTNVTVDRNSIKDELEQLSAEISRIGQQTQFNTKNILNAGAADTTESAAGTAIAVNLQVGANCGQAITVTFSSMNATTLSVKVADTTTGTSIGVQDHANATKAICQINDAIEAVSKERSKYGAVQNRLEHTIANVDNASENLQAAESRIRDVDMAAEMLTYSKNNILQQAAQAML
ncbi:MAG: flagellin, partial [Clostridiales bacterium]|nr:flagellin [Clostridiales bacterium]